MKHLSTIISAVIIILVAALIGSVLYNNFIFTLLEVTDAESLRQVIVCREMLEVLQQAQDTKAPDAELNSTEPETVIPAEDSESEVPEPEETQPTLNSDIKVETTEDKIIYEDNYARITYIKQELSIFGPTVKFLIENKSEIVLDISFTDVYIDGYMAELCGVYVSELSVSKKAFGTLYLYESDYENFTSYPSLVEFDIVVRDSDSWTELSKSDTIYIKIEK